MGCLLVHIGCTLPKLYFWVVAKYVANYRNIVKKLLDVVLLGSVQQLKEFNDVFEEQHYVYNISHKGMQI